MLVIVDDVERPLGNLLRLSLLPFRHLSTAMSNISQSSDKQKGLSGSAPYHVFNPRASHIDQRYRQQHRQQQITFSTTRPIGETAGAFELATPRHVFPGPESPERHDVHSIALTGTWLSPSSISLTPSGAQERQAEFDTQFDLTTGR
nr:hypothetical protein CFP56_50328 [Quercus suber]